MTARVEIIGGRLVSPHMVLGPAPDYPEYHHYLMYQTYEHGVPQAGNYRGPATIDWKGGRILLGDPIRQANLTELTVDQDPTPESKETYLGFVQAIKDKRRKSDAMLMAHSENWRWGYMDGWKEKAGKWKNPASSEGSKLKARLMR